MSPLPSHSIIFSKGGRAEFVGASYSERKGHFTGHMNFDQVARWLQAQPTLMVGDESFPRMVDGGRVTLTFIMADGHQVTKEWTYQPDRGDLWAAAEVIEGVASKVQWEAAP